MPAQKSKTLCDQDELVGLMREGDMEALARITQCYGERLLAVGRSRCRNEDEARDAVQDTLLAAQANMAAFKGEGRVEGWLVRIVINACHRMRRGRKNDPNLHDPEAIVLSDEDSPERKAMTGQLLSNLGQALLALPDRDRVIVLLSEVDGMTGQEIAESLDMTPGAVRTRLSRARTRLRTFLEKQGKSPLFD